MANPTKKDVVYFQPQAHEPIIGNQMQRMCNVISTLNDEMNNVEQVRICMVENEILFPESGRLENGDDPRNPLAFPTKRITPRELEEGRAIRIYQISSPTPVYVPAGMPRAAFKEYEENYNETRGADEWSD